MRSATTRSTAFAMAAAITARASQPVRRDHRGPVRREDQRVRRAAMNFAQVHLWAYGWDHEPVPPSHALWMGESGWNYRANNPNAGATGIPQALPGRRWRRRGADWRTNPATQIRWGLGYIKQVYGSPPARTRRGSARVPHWYSEGGLIPGYADGG